MTSQNFSAHLVTGTVTIERLDAVTLPPILRSHATTLTTAHEALASSVAHADDVRGARTTAMRGVEAADEALAASLQDLAIEIIAARLGSTTKPFTDFGGKSLSQYANMSRVRAVKEVTIVLSAINAANPPETVHAAALKCAKQCRAVTEAYAELGAHRVAFRKARGAREEALNGFTSAFTDARNIAKVAWRGSETYDIVFGAIEKDRFGKKSHTKKHEMTPEPKPEPTASPVAMVTTPPPTSAGASVATPPVAVSAAHLN